MHAHEKGDPLKGLLAGLAGGFVGTLVMTAAQSALSRFLDSKPVDGQERDEDVDDDSHKNKPATEKAAAAVAEKVFHRTLSEKQEHVAGHAVHYGFGTLTGAAYGVACEFIPDRALLGGAPFGLAVMLGADETAIPALQLGPPPWKTPASTHAYSFFAHLVYGATAELVRRQVRAMLS